MGWKYSRKKSWWYSITTKNNAISKEAAKAKIMNVQNVDLCSIDEHNVDEVIDLELEAA